ncbi:MAG: hypothetical protein V7603_2099 [Micromonosporaceae bacterium]
MATNPASPAQQAREALGIRLREIRKDAGLTGRALATAIGCHYTRVSRIEHGNQLASEEYVKRLCRVCRAEVEIPDLIASVRAIDSIYLEWRRQTRAGMKRLMLSSVPLYERTRIFRIYEHNIIPGLFQTADYSAAMLSYFIDFLDTPNDLESAIEARMERQRVLYTGDRRFLVVLEERAIRAQVGTVDTMLGQLDRVLAVMSLQRVSLGIIPAGAPRTVFASVGFWMYDEAMVAVETPTASVEVTQPRELRLYGRMFEQLQGVAVYGTGARGIVRDVMEELTSSQAHP